MTTNPSIPFASPVCNTEGTLSLTQSQFITSWSRDARYLCFDGILDNQEGYYRVQISDHKLERIFSMKGFQAAGGVFGNWSGLAPDESPLLVRDASIQEIYALDWNTQ